MATVAQAQFTPMRFDIEAGMPSQQIYDILQTRDGYLWIATENGIARFDGVTFDVFNTRNTPEIPANPIQALFEDSRGNLWIGTRNAGIMRYSEGHFEPMFGEINSNILSISEDTHGRLWIGTDGGGAYIVENDSVGEVGVDDGLTSVHVRTLLPLTDGGMLVGNILGGMSFFTSDGVRSYLVPDGFPQSIVTQFVPNPDGGLWIATNNGVFRYQEGNFKRYDFHGIRMGMNSVRALAYDSEGAFYAGTVNGLLRYNPETDRFDTIPEFDGLFITRLFLDREGHLWMGSWPDGLIQLRKTTFQQVQGFNPALYGNPMLVSEGDRDELWVLTINGLYNNRSGRFEKFESEFASDKNQITSILYDHLGRFWVATEEHVVYYKDNKPTLIKFPGRENPHRNSTHFMTSSPDGSVWLGSSRDGFYRYKDGVVHWSNRDKGLSNDRVNAIRYGPDGSIWAGTGFGLNRFLPDGRVEVYQTEHGLTNPSVLSLLIEDTETVWIGSGGGGLFRLKDGEIFAFDMLLGNVSDSVFDMFMDEEARIWVGGASGVHLIEASVLHEVADGKRTDIPLRAFTEADGFPGRQVTGGGYRGRNTGRFYYPTLRGIGWAESGRILENNTPPLIHIAEAKVDFAAVAYRDKVVLPPGALNLEIGFTGINFTYPEGLQYRYRLKPFDPAWVEAGNRRSAFYTNIPPGSYTFEVHAQNENGVWSLSPAFVEVLVKPTFVQTWYFKAGVLLTALLILYAIYHYRMTSLRRLEELRVRIAFDLHDEIGSNLGSIALRSQMLGRNASLGDSERAHLDEIGKISRQTADAMRDIIWLVNPERDKVSDMVEKLKQTASAFFSEIPVKFEVDLDQGPLSISLMTRRNILLIFKEALHNILKHARATEVQIRLSLKGTMLSLIIRDNGRGIEKSPVSDESRGSGLGLRSMRERAVAMKGQFEVESEPGNGTLIRLSVPVT